MPIPTNITSTTAVELGPFPNTITQRVDSGGTTYNVWYKYTATFTGIVSVFAFGDLTVYKPGIGILSPDAVTVYAPLVGFIIGNYTTTTGNAPVQFPVTIGTVYYIQVLTNFGNPTPANLTIKGVAAPAPVDAPIGSLFINSDFAYGNNAAPATLLSSVSGAVSRFLPSFATGEAGNVLTNGVMLFYDLTTSALKLYSPNFTLAISIPIASPLMVDNISSNKAHVFYVAVSGSGGVTNIGTVNDSGSYTPNLWTLPVTNIVSLAPSPDETILYYLTNTGGTNAPVKRWSLTTNSALSDLAPGVGTGIIASNDIVVLADGTILVGYGGGEPFGNPAVPGMILHYSAAGATLNTYNLAINMVGPAPMRLAYAVDDPNSFWVYYHSGTEFIIQAQFYNIHVSDGALLTSITVPGFDGGLYYGPISSTPAMFGPPFSCTMIVTRVDVPAPSVIKTGGLYTIVANKTNDTLYSSISGDIPPVTTSVIVAIPNPFFLL